MSETRGSSEWFDAVRTTGRWDRPRFWKSPDYRDGSPWSAKEHSDAFDALRRVYPPKVVRKAFASSPDTFPVIARYLSDPFRPDLSGLLALGFDALHAKAHRYGSLLDALRTSDGFAGARLELAILAALERQGFRCEHEPYAVASTKAAKRGEKQRNPDLRLYLDGWVTADIKHLQVSERSTRRNRRFYRMVAGANGLDMIRASVEVLPLYTRLERSVENEERLEHLADKLHHAANERLQWMIETGRSESTLAGLIRLKRSSGWHHMGHPMSDPRDADRIMERLEEASSQIPRTDIGLVFLEPSESESDALVLPRVEQWLAAAGTSPVVGVVVLSQRYVERARHLLVHAYPVWRGNAPAKLRRASHWSRLWAGLNWRWLRAYEVWR